MKNDRALRYAMLGGLALVVVLLLVVVLQLDALEERFITQGRELRALGEATERLRRGGVGPRTATSAAPNEIPPGVTVLHPEVANFLQPKDTRWPPPGAVTNGVLARGWEHGEPKGFNILLENSGLLFEYIYPYTLGRFGLRNYWTDPDVYHGDLAWRFEVTDDSREFTAYLRPGVKWHPIAGVPLEDPKYAWLRGEREVTADDFAFTLELLAHPQVQTGFWKNYFAGVESWKVVDARTLVVRWKKKEYLNLTNTVELWPTPRFLYAFDQDGRPFPRETLGLRFNQHWYNNKGLVSTGPYRMASYQPGAKIVLERNEEYVGDKPAIQRIEFSIYSDLKQTLLKLRAHELSMGELTAGQYREEILEPRKSGKKPAGSPFFDGRIHCEPIKRPAYSYVGWNAARPMFSDKRVRWAMTHAFDRQRIIDNVYAGLGTIGTGPFAPDSPNNDPGVKVIPFDLAAAKKLLTDAGWADTDGDGLLDKELHAGDGKRSPFEFRLMFANGQKETEASLKIFADDLLKLGVKMLLEPQEWSLLLKRKDERQFDALTASWQTPWLTDPYQVWHSSQIDLPKGSNAVAFRNAEADKLIEELRVTFDKDARIRLLRAFHRIVAEEQPYTFFMTRKKVYCTWNDVKNVVWSKDIPIEYSLPWWVTGGAR
ncbi:MAG TPA: ABC transporter substrate-binding protein [Polyangiaceae bacterium]